MALSLSLEFSPRLLAAASAALLSASCGGERSTTEVCSPIVKFTAPDGVTPTADDGVVSLPVRIECDNDYTIWAWSSAGDTDIALDVFEQDDGDGWVVVAPVRSRALDDCAASAITVALVDDYGEIIDQDRTWITYEIAR